LLICIPFGVLLGGLSAVMIYGLSWLENSFERLFPNEYLRHMAGMLAVGLLLYGLLLAVDRYYVAGVGYATILDVLRGVLSDPGLLALLFVAKLLATGLTLGSGASGGVFAPSLFLGATLGGSTGHLVDWVFPGLGIEPVVVALAGMAGIVGGTTGAVLTAITMIMEQTRDYAAILPIIATVAIAFAVRAGITAENIYTFRLAQAGATVPQGLQSGIATAHSAYSIMSADFQLIDIHRLSDWLRAGGLEQGHLHTVVTRGNRIVGVLRPESPHLRSDRNPSKAVDRNILLVTPQTSLPAIMRGMHERGTEIALVTRERRFRQWRHLEGIITSHEVTATAIDSAELLE
jgi:CIC family chloride channel protein